MRNKPLVIAFGVVTCLVLAMGAYILFGLNKGTGGTQVGSAPFDVAIIDDNLPPYINRVSRDKIQTEGVSDHAPDYEAISRMSDVDKIIKDDAPAPSKADPTPSGKVHLTDNVTPQDLQRDDAKLFFRGKQLYHLGYYDDSIRTFIDLSTHFPMSPYRYWGEIYMGRSLLARGLANKNREDFIRAKKLFLRVYSNYDIAKYIPVKDLSEFIIEMGEANRIFGEPSLEIEHRIRAFLDRNEPYLDQSSREGLYTQLGYLKFFEKNYDEALMYFMKSGSELSLLGRARVYIRQQRYADAIRIYEDFVNYNKSSIYYNDVLNAFKLQSLYFGKSQYDKQEYNSALVYLKKVYDYFPDTTEAEDALYHIGETYFKKGDFGEALNFYTKITNRQSEYYDHALLRTGQCYYEQGKLERSLNIFQNMVDTRANSPLYNEAKRWKEFVEAELEEALIRDNTR